MSGKLIIANATVVNEKQIYAADIIIENGLISQIIKKGSKPQQSSGSVTFSEVIDAAGLYVFPGCIDDQVHFREPGLTHKADIFTESRAAVAGGITSYMDMPNTKPPVLTQKALEEKYAIAAEKSLANYSFYMGASNDNFDEVCKTNPDEVCGLKIFMGSSTGNMLVDDIEILKKLFALKQLLIATHCEDENIIQKKTAQYKKKYGQHVPIECHPEIRSREACYESTLKAVNLAKEYGTRLHVLHLSTAEELSLFSSEKLTHHKRITAEVCVHHLVFNSDDYQTHGRLIKWNPAIKEKRDQRALLDAINNNTIDVIATDHAPHSYIEKQQPYFDASSGGPMVQHALVAMLEMYHQNKISLETIVDKMCHAPAICYRIQNRGFIREGYHADLTIVDLNDPWEVSPQNILYKCGWTPLMGKIFKSRVTHTIVNGNLAYQRGEFLNTQPGQRLLFNTL